MHRILCLILVGACWWQMGQVSAAQPDGIAQQPGRLAPARIAEWRIVPAEQLAGKRAGADTVSNNMDLNGAVSGNSAINVVTGANAISSGAFSNASGLPVAIQNSGANVLIQNATIINVQMK